MNSHRATGLLTAILTVLLSLTASGQTTGPTARINHPALKSLDWQLAAGASAFDGESAFQMIDQLHAMGVHHIELLPGQSLSAQQPEVKISHDMTADQLAALQTKLKSVKMDVVSYGAISLGDDESEWKKAFEFGKALKLKNILVSEQPSLTLKMLDQLAQQTGVNVAVVFDPNTTDPTVMLKRVQDLSFRVGVLATVQAWESAGADPAKIMQGLSGRVMELHLDGMVKSGNLMAVLQQCKQQGFKGVCEVDAGPAEGSHKLNAFISSVNAFSDAAGLVAALTK